MSLDKYSFWEVLLHSFSSDVWKIVGPAVWETLYMVAVSAVITLTAGTMLGIALSVISKEGVRPLPVVSGVVGAVINCLRSLPQMIMIIITLPLARAILGQSYGVNACIIALAASCIPMFARLVQSALVEIPKGKIEAAKSMGSSGTQIVFRIMLPEALPSIIRAFTVALIAIISMTALAGSFGAGGIGDIAVRYGFNRFQHDMLFASVFVLIIMVQIIQSAGDIVSNLILKKRHLL